MLDPIQYQDLCNFEGNANGFKILVQDQDGIPGGLRLSYATLWSFIKYPKASLPIKPSNHVADKKFGVFQSQLKFFKELITLFANCKLFNMQRIALKI